MSYELEAEAANGVGLLISRIMPLFKIEETKDEAEFSAQMDSVIEHNALGIAIAVGHRIGLIQTMVNLTEPRTSSEIARIAGLNER